jgi:hypothetical protein
MRSKSGVAPKISDEGVQAKTGKTWAEWFKILDAAGARKLAHPEIATYLSERHKVPSWWRQMVTVTYEQARGLRQVHEKPGGFEISVSRTLTVPVAKAFAAWEDLKKRRRWLDDAGFTVRKATADKTLRITWVDGNTSLDVYFNSKGEGKCQVAAQHSKLKHAKQADRMKKYWGKQLDQLKQLLEA